MFILQLMARCRKLKPNLQYFSLRNITFVVLADDGNWNPVEWERAAEELTWERVRCLNYCFLKKGVLSMQPKCLG